MFIDRMLTLVPGIGPGRAERLRREGVDTWSQILDHGQLSLFPSQENFAVERLQHLLEAKDVHSLSSLTPGKYKYLLALEFPELVTFLDIETTGLSHIYHTLTLVGYCGESQWHAEIMGRGAMFSEDFRDRLASAPILVTFNGILFDIPFLQSNETLPRHESLDLRFLSRRLGYSGSQKSVEEQLGIRRPRSIGGVRGEQAPALWHRTIRGDRRALSSLLKYNYYDVRGLYAILLRLAPEALVADGIARHRSSGMISEAKSRIKHLRPSPYSPMPKVHADTILRGVAHNAEPLVKRNPHRDSLETVVGVDLTGSSARPSGVAIVSGESISTRLVREDHEIISLIRDSGASLVSIDAPLSLPKGRTSVYDSDPGRYEFGILRWCERELKRRGINSYPSLLPSMQQLTARGIRLARTLRASGIPVIESYPGAAQDIIAMPRKGVSVQILQHATEALGWRLPDSNLSHDELDAVTSALVGLFFLDGRYESLGTEWEDAMIVPRLEPPSGDRRMAVLITGPIAAGKTTLARELAELGFSYARYSQVVDAELEARGLIGNRDNRQVVGMDLHNVVGQREMGRRLLATLRPDSSRVVIDGGRWLEDRAFLFEELGGLVLHVHIDAPLMARRDRYVATGREESEFWRANQHHVEGETPSLRAAAHVVLDNNGSAQDIQGWGHAIRQMANKKADQSDRLLYFGGGIEGWSAEAVGGGSATDPVARDETGGVAQEERLRKTGEC